MEHGHWTAHEPSVESCKNRFKPWTTRDALSKPAAGMLDGHALDENGTPDSSFQSSPANALTVLPDVTSDSDQFDHDVDDVPRSSAVVGRDSTWRPILSDSSQVVLYNAASHALTVQRHEGLSDRHSTCPYCNRPLQQLQSDELPLFEESQAEHTRVSNYFHLLEVANDSHSRPASPRSPRLRSSSSVSGDPTLNGGPGFNAETMAEGYFSAFFKEEQKLGMGANGSVYLCQVTSFPALRELLALKHGFLAYPGRESVRLVTSRTTYPPNYSLNACFQGTSPSKRSPSDNHIHISQKSYERYNRICLLVMPVNLNS